MRQRPAAAQVVAAPPISMWAFMASGDVATNVSIVMLGELLTPIFHASDGSLANELQRAEKKCDAGLEKERTKESYRR